jgi:hypothetical protein
LGQYKRDRNLELLREFAASAPSDWRLILAGRGWPEITGWKVDSRFLSENELNDRIDQSSVVLIPYRRFYQSGIAVRAIERGVPVVGPTGTALSRLLGANNPLLCDADVHSWLRAAAFGISMSAHEVEDIRLKYMHTTLQCWQNWFEMILAK